MPWLLGIAAATWLVTCWVLDVRESRRGARLPAAERLRRRELERRRALGYDDP